VLPDFFAGGAQKVMLALAAGLDRSIFEPSIIVMNGQGPWSERVDTTLPVTNLRKTSLRYALPRLRRSLAEASPDIVLSTMGYLNLGVLMLKPFLGPHVKIIVREANAVWPSARGHVGAGVFKFAYRMLYNHANLVLSPSRKIISELTSDFRVKSDLLTLLRNPVEVDELRAAAQKPERHNMDKPQFVCVGRLSPQKSYDRLLDTISNHGGAGHITIFGEGPERAKLEQKIDRLELQDQITLAGFSSNPAPWVAGADALLLPSLWEGLPNVVLEALACGAPVISTPEAGAIGEIAELASEGAVTLAPMGREFSDAMCRKPVGKSLKLRPSLLPEAFEPDMVNAAFEKTLLDCLH